MAMNAARLNSMYYLLLMKSISISRHRMAGHPSRLLENNITNYRKRTRRKACLVSLAGPAIIFSLTRVKSCPKLTP
jgi:hypothetical protein